MKKTTLIAAISFLLTLPTLAQVPDIKPAKSSDTGDARVAALGQDAQPWSDGTDRPLDA